MKKSVFLGALAASTVLAGAAFAGTLDDVKARGELICGSRCRHGDRPDSDFAI